MSGNGEPAAEARSISAIDRAREVSRALADAARLARISPRSRRALASGGFRARRGERLMRWLVRISFFVMVLAPSAIAAIYFVFIASDQYVAEARFTLAGGEPPTADTFGSFTGIPAIALVQDTQIVTDFIQSRAAIEQPDSKIDFRKLYSADTIDWWARFDKSKSIEKFTQYWKSMVNVSIAIPSGVVDLKVRAFSPQDASEIASEIIARSEALINGLNARMDREAVANAEDEFNRMSARLTKASLALEAARNDTGLLDAHKSSDALSELITGARGALLQLKQQYATQLNYVAETAPQMLTLKSRIDASSAQIAELESKITKTDLTGEGDFTLANAMSKFEELDLERQVAEKLYGGAAASLEIAHIAAESKFMYLNTFVWPAVPEEAEYPHRALYPIAVFLGLLAFWGACFGIAVAVRNYGS